MSNKKQFICANRNECRFSGGDECRHSEEHDQCNLLDPHPCVCLNGKNTRCVPITPEDDMDKIKKQIDVVYECMEKYKREKKKLAEMIREQGG